ncbi:MarR family transcriptional regulator [Mycolicibacterium grossiae]|uniref:MarR family transcriptional regulator n=2 Tax=Mycolicibacterium grossiae TaxID=1552759 RepID=A0A1E8QA03_9MYCO|nr:MarR family transcriptional regulator [Mycolicibacterium grossiae]OFJ55256.1 MarR family transcriptional regulator [Mycolicibacterium grossiae]QEM46119.1 MarR family transcriptional regulator [Mycolicibacterium grossiae]
MPDGDKPLGYLLQRVTTRLRTEVTDAVLAPLGLTFPEYICMRMLSHAPGRSNAELARDVNVSPQAMNTVVRGLQDRNLITRPASVPSGRSLPIELTRAGTALLARTDTGVREAERKTLAPLSDADQRTLRRLLADLG